MGRTLIFFVVAWSSAAYCAGQLQDAPLFKPTVSAKNPSDAQGSSPENEPRTWADVTGRFKTEATFVSRNGAEITLRKVDGVIIRVPVDRLSEDDKRHLEQLSKHTPGIVGQAARSVVDATSSISKGVANAVANGNLAAGERSMDDAVDSPGSLKEREEPLAADESLVANLVCVQISRNAMNRFLAQPMTRHSAVNDTIVGTPVRGTAQTAGRLDLHLVSADTRAVVDLRFNGRVRSRTIGFGGPVRVHCSSTTRFEAVKRVVLDEDGIELMPARARAETSIAIEGVTTDLPRLRGRIARRIGSQQAAAKRAAAEVESARKAEEQIARELDEEVFRQLRKGHGKLLQSLAALPIDRSKLDTRLQFATSGEYLHVTLHRVNGRPSRVLPPKPGELGSPELVVHLHSSLVNHVLQNVELQQSLEPLVKLVLGQELQGFIGLAPWGPDVELKQSSDGQWWSLVVRPAVASTPRRSVQMPVAKLLRH